MDNIGTIRIKTTRNNFKLGKQTGEGLFGPIGLISIAYHQSSNISRISLSFKKFKAVLKEIF